MEPEKRKIIVKEIGHWRRSKLLPEQYCDFLLNLYSDSEESNSPQESIRLSHVLQNSGWKIWLLGIGFISFISFVLLHFNSFQPQMQIGISALFVILLYGVGIYKRATNPSIAYIAIGAASFLLLFSGEYVMYLNDLREPSWMIGHLVFCSLLWIVFGWLGKVGMLHFCGWAGALLFYGWLLYQKLGTMNWVQLELAWIPLSALFAWMGWALHSNNKSARNVFFILCIFLWFGPEIYSMALYGVSETSQGFLAMKIIGEGILLFSLRKKWTEWVA